MKTLKVLSALALMAVVGCATVNNEANLPEGNPRTYADYGPAMKSTSAQPLVANWQVEHAAEITAATRREVLERYVDNAKAADSLLAEVKPAYESDPIKLTQIAAVTQLVMCPKCGKAPEWRKVWVAALNRALAGASDEYRRAFFRDQLNWCK